MKMQSMTGFSRFSNADEAGDWLWELRCVNGKGLDLRFRLPPGFEELDPKMRDISRKYLRRGSCNFSLTFNRQGGAKVVQLNEGALLSAAKAYQDAVKILGVGEPASLDSIMAVKGVMELVEPQDDRVQLEKTKSVVLQDFETALKALVQTRSEEGQRLGALFQDYLASIRELVTQAENSPARQVKAIESRLDHNIQMLLDRADSLDEARLHQEAVILATRADIEEEIQRLHCHVEAASALLEEQGAVGRKFDFLIQEFNREANTLCAKANADDITKIGLQLKYIIDQMREQVQNIE